ncbi:FUSC family protein [Carnobacterium sp.]|uniref:FUSC family protein n=1 Tax=Carnobacterium sp. TaxID=48221 RepID=UPI003C7078BF
MKKIVSNTVMFAMILAFINLFGYVFGVNNNLVGITILIVLLVLMQEDLTQKPVENFMKLTSINLISGILTYFSSQNIWIGLVLNFIALSTIGYFFSSRLNKIMVVPFGLHYLFMLYNPVSGIDFNKRLIGLIAGAVLVMIVQFIVHRKNISQEEELLNPGPIDEFNSLYEPVRLFGREYAIHSIRGAYALRIGLITAITAFIVAFFNLQEGRWVVYTVFALTELYSEDCISRSKQRIQGTILGTLIVLVLFFFIKDTSLRAMIILVGGYLDSYTTNYRDKMICVTISVIASTALVNNTLYAAVNRVGYILVGTALALLVDKLIFQKQYKDYETLDTAN